ncbi:hypothetical protein [Microvirga terricola]|uniref:Transposase n=1 Tax=Microvirga terricola TaxID=2719797 RepID=A0ABX0VCY4_9HYPH|nr:hypothetical protein [Microvirga terricola]NIX77306.1 hypothetical protein [Microvirga terricola]
MASGLERRADPEQGFAFVHGKAGEAIENEARFLGSHRRQHCSKHVLDLPQHVTDSGSVNACRHEQARIGLRPLDDAEQDFDSVDRLNVALVRARLPNAKWWKDFPNPYPIRRELLLS